MKKHILIVLIITFCSISISAQIGIMTENPATNVLLHIDALKNNESGTEVNIDDVVIDKDGNVGLGTVDPQTKLHIVTGGTSTAPNPQFRIQDGYQAANKVLMSNDNGVAKWSDYIPGYQVGTIGTGITYPTTSSAWAKTNVSISLDPGQWMIFYTISMTANALSVPQTNYRFWIQICLGDNTDIATADALSRNRFSNNGFMNKRIIINGWLVIDNKTLLPKVYSLYVGDVQRALTGLNLLNVGANDGYSSIYAFRVLAK